MKEIFYTLIFFLIVSSSKGQFRSFAKKNHSVNKVVKELATDTDFKNAGFAFFAVDANSGEVISAYQPDLALKPASVLKLITTATLLELVGPEFKFKTSLYYTGTLDTLNHILIGDIIIQGGGDPTLASFYFDTTQQFFLNQCVKAIKSLKIDSIAGQIIGDASYFSDEMVPSTWSWQNMGNYFGAGASGLSIYDNTFTLTFETTNRIGESTKIIKVDPTIPGILFKNQSVSDSIGYDNITLFGAPFSNTRIIKGSLPLNQSSFQVKGSLPDPSFLAACELQQKLASEGIFCRELATSQQNRTNSKKGNAIEPILLFSNFSPPLKHIIEKTNVYSLNLFAEHCLLQIAKTESKKTCTDTATMLVTEFWQRKGMDIQGLSINDGSGLSHYNTITPKQVVFVLNYMHKQSLYKDEFLQSITVSGNIGTLKKVAVGTIAEGNLRAKSGTLNRTKCFAGYVTSLSGREIIFTVMANNYTCTNLKASKKLEKLLVSLAEFNK